MVINVSQQGSMILTPRAVTIGLKYILYHGTGEPIRADREREMRGMRRQIWSEDCAGFIDRNRLSGGLIPGGIGMEPCLSSNVENLYIFRSGVFGHSHLFRDINSLCNVLKKVRFLLSNRRVPNG